MIQSRSGGIMIVMQSAQGVPYCREDGAQYSEDAQEPKYAMPPMIRASRSAGPL